MSWPAAGQVDDVDDSMLREELKRSPERIRRNVRVGVYDGEVRRDESGRRRGIRARC